MITPVDFRNAICVETFAGTSKAGNPFARADFLLEDYTLCGLFTSDLASQPVKGMRYDITFGVEWGQRGQRVVNLQLLPASGPSDFLTD